MINEVKYEVLRADAKLKLFSNQLASGGENTTPNVVMEPKFIYYNTLENDYYLKFNHHPDPTNYCIYLKSLYNDFTNELYSQLFTPGLVIEKLKYIDNVILSCNFTEEIPPPNRYSNPFNKILIKPIDDIGYPIIDNVLNKLFHRNFNKPRLRFIADVRSFLFNLKKFFTELQFIGSIPDIPNLESSLPHLALLSTHYFNPKVNVIYTESSSNINFNNFNDTDKYSAFINTELKAFKIDIHRLVRNNASIPQLYWLFNSLKFRLTSLRFSYRKEQIINEVTKQMIDEYYYKNDFSLINIYHPPDKVINYNDAVKLVSPYFKIQFNTLPDILEFLDVNIVSYESDITKLFSTTVHSKNQLNKSRLKKQTPKDHFEIPVSFTYKYYKSNLPALTNVLNSLKKSGFVPADTDLKDFRKIFNNTTPKLKIKWLGTISELKFFVDYIHRDIQAIEDLKVYIWKVAVKCFEDKNGNPYDSKRFRCLKDPSNTSDIRAAANFLSGHTAL